LQKLLLGYFDLIDEQMSVLPLESELEMMDGFTAELQVDDGSIRFSAYLANADVLNIHVVLL